MRAHPGRRLRVGAHRSLPLRPAGVDLPAVTRSSWSVTIAALIDRILECAAAEGRGGDRRRPASAALRRHERPTASGRRLPPRRLPRATSMPFAAGTSASPRKLAEQRSTGEHARRRRGRRLMCYRTTWTRVSPAPELPDARRSRSAPDDRPSAERPYDPDEHLACCVNTGPVALASAAAGGACSTITGFVTLVALVVIALALWLDRGAGSRRHPRSAGRPRRSRSPTGLTADAVARLLESEGIVTSADDFVARDAGAGGGRRI